ncbi:hypothetical protein SAY86_010256 [Trapa natans]|uniref:Ubiquitin carboxyl-terminal hydrolase n=1 Tax=Trapa natans TaxID=22666 RepID=A0AAN7QRY8_TRANT|nr:hypothetical protein SAY86_010256 [Trapa natans]
MINLISVSGEASKHQMIWCGSVSALLKSVGGLIGIAGLILAIKRDEIFGTSSCLWGFRGQKSNSEEDYFVPGLKNRGNNCFFNVILQALASCSYFQSFLEEAMEESQKMALHEFSEDLTLTVALDATLKGLQILSEKKVVLNPMKVMDEMSYHISNFSLMIQQDASEALGLLINSLRKESCSYYLPCRDSFAVLNDTDRILSPDVTSDKSEQERWQKHFLGPFDGITGSILSCQSCSSQLTLDFEFFHTLILSPVFTHGSNIMRGCTLLDCLRQFTASHRENWRHCNCCWHAAAAKYLSLTAKGEGEIEKLEACTWGDCCECKSMSSLKNFQWLDNHSRIVRRTAISRPPKILCIQLARVAMTGSGAAFKLEGNIKFPLLLDLSPFMFSEFQSNMQGNMSSSSWMQQLGQHQEVHLCPASLNPQGDKATLNINATKHANESHGSLHQQVLDLTQSECRLNITMAASSLRSDDEIYQIPKRIPEANHLYRLVSVLEHFGGPQSGHYTIYRSVRAKPPENGHAQNLPNQVPVIWFRISDADVQHASEADILEAEASILFYERMPDSELKM